MKGNKTSFYFLAFCLLLMTSFTIKEDEVTVKVLNTSIEKYIEIEVDKEVLVGSLRPEEINKIVSEDPYYYSRLYSFFEGIDIDICRVIIEEALKNDVPVNLAFSLAYCESGYDTSSISKKNRDGSYDYGLFQLNIFTFPNFRTNFHYVRNTQIALAYLKSEYDKYLSYDLAFIGYNAGSVKRFNDITKQHLKNIRDKEKELNEWFSKTYRSKGSRNAYKGEILTTWR